MRIFSIALLILCFWPLPDLQAAKLTQITGDNGVIVGLAAAAANTALDKSSNILKREAAKRYGLDYHQANLNYDEKADQVVLSGYFSEKGRAFGKADCHNLMSELKREIDKSLTHKKHINEVYTAYQLLSGGKSTKSPQQLAGEVRSRMVIKARIENPNGVNKICRANLAGTQGASLSTY